MTHMNGAPHELSATDDAGPALAPWTDTAVGIDELVHRIGQELNGPLRDVARALDRARLSHSEADNRVLHDRVSRLLRVGSALADLAPPWGGAPGQADGPVELWPILQEAWAAVEPEARQRQVQVRFSLDVASPGIAHVHGHERWLRRVLVECLDDAVKATPCGVLLDVELQRRGPRLNLMLRIHEPVVADTGLLAGLVRSLCREVLGRHGGDLRLCDQGSRRYLLLELPAVGGFGTRPSPVTGRPGPAASAPHVSSVADPRRAEGAALT